MSDRKPAKPKKPKAAEPAALADAFASKTRMDVDALMLTVQSALQRLNEHQAQIEVLQARIDILVDSHNARSSTRTPVFTIWPFSK